MIRFQNWHEWLIALISLSVAANLLTCSILGIERTDCIVSSIITKQFPTEEPWNYVRSKVVARIQSVKYNISDTAILIYSDNNETISKVIKYYDKGSIHTCLVVKWPFFAINDFSKPKIMVNGSAMLTMILLLVFGLIASLSIVSYVVVNNIHQCNIIPWDEHKDDDDVDMELLQEDID